MTSLHDGLTASERIREPGQFCSKCGLGLYWTFTPDHPLCGDCAERERIAEIIRAREAMS